MYICAVAGLGWALRARERKQKTPRLRDSGTGWLVRLLTGSGRAGRPIWTCGELRSASAELGQTREFTTCVAMSSWTPARVSKRSRLEMTAEVTVYPGRHEVT